MDSFTIDNSFFLNPDFYIDPIFNLPDLSHSSLDLLPLENVPAKRKSRVRASRACLQCRSKHMKCDSVEPKCTRCQLDQKPCTYLKSRRGGSQKSPPSVLSGVSSTTAGRTPSVQAESTSDTSPIGLHPTAANSQNTSVERLEPGDLVTKFYEYFHDAHPIIMPRHCLLSHRDSDPESLVVLLPVLEYIGSVYEPAIATEPYRQAVEEALNPAKLPGNAFSVQALVLYSLSRHCSDEYELADRTIDKAIDIALSIGMNRKDFAVSNGQDQPILQESWRRTWWTLWLCNSLFDAISHRRTFRLRDVPSDVDLPCEDSEYESGRIPTPKSIEEYDNREFSEGEVKFSSFTYLIDAMRIASGTMAIDHSTIEPGDRILSAIDAKIVNWHLYLPECKKEYIRADGSSDETMFLAHITINAEQLLLHRPHSRLFYSDVEEESKCTPPSSRRQNRAIQRSIAMHTTKSLQAIETTMTLFTMPTPLLKHTPIFTCAVAITIMAQVSACNNIFEPTTIPYVAGRDRVRLGLAVLKSAMGTWGLAKRSVREVVSVAKQLFAIELSQENAPKKDPPNEGLSIFDGELNKEMGHNDL